jgi:hypothetical protein
MGRNVTQFLEENPPESPLVDLVVSPARNWGN